METYWIEDCQGHFCTSMGHENTIFDLKKKKEKKTNTKTYYSSHKIKQVSPQPINVAHVLGKINM